MKLIKILLINLIVFLVGFLFLELSLRSFLTLKHYSNPYSSYWGKTWFRYNPINYISFDKELKFKPIPNTELKDVDLPRWEKNSNITINDLGFRDNRNNQKIINDKRILTIGDSFTFGSQVTDRNTWQSCLERAINQKIDNAGVPGYSAGQAVKRGLIESKKRNYSHIIWSIYFRDFRRDITEKILFKKDDKIYFSNFINDSIKDQSSFSQKIFFITKEYFFTIYYIDEKILNLKFKKSKNIDKKINKTENETLIEFVKYLVDFFNEIPIEKKIILFQYGHIKKNDNSNNNPEVYEIKILKDMILKLSQDKNIQIIDTIKAIDKYDEKNKKLLWFDHHTNKGNKMVCDLLSKNLKLID